MTTPTDPFGGTATNPTDNAGDTTSGFGAYTSWNWMQMEAKLLGEDVKDGQGEAGPVPSTLWNAANAFQYVTEILNMVGQSIHDQAHALAGGDDAPWKGDAATAFLSVMTTASAQVTAQAAALQGGAAGIMQGPGAGPGDTPLPIALVSAGNQLSQSQAYAIDIDHYYMNVQQQLFNTPVVNNAVILSDQLSGMLTADMLHYAMKPLADNYTASLTSIIAPQQVTPPNSGPGAGGDGNLPPPPGDANLPPLPTGANLPPPPGDANLPPPPTGANLPPGLSGANLPPPTDLSSVPPPGSAALDGLPPPSGAALDGLPPPSGAALDELPPPASFSAGDGPGLDLGGPGDTAGLPGLDGLPADTAGLGDTGLGDTGLGDTGLGDTGLGDTGLGDARGLPGLAGLGSGGAADGLPLESGGPAGEGAASGLPGGAGDELPMMPGMGAGAGAGGGTERPDSAGLLGSDAAPFSERAALPSDIEPQAGTPAGGPLTGLEPAALSPAEPAAAGADPEAAAELAEELPMMASGMNGLSAAAGGAERPDAAGLMASDDAAWAGDTAAELDAEGGAAASRGGLAGLGQPASATQTARGDNDRDELLLGAAALAAAGLADRPAPAAAAPASSATDGDPGAGEPAAPELAAPELAAAQAPAGQGPDGPGDGPGPAFDAGADDPPADRVVRLRPAGAREDPAAWGVAADWDDVDWDDGDGDDGDGESGERAADAAAAAADEPAGEAAPALATWRPPAGAERAAAVAALAGPRPIMAAAAAAAGLLPPEEPAEGEQDPADLMPASAADLLTAEAALWGAWQDDPGDLA